MKNIVKLSALTLRQCFSYEPSTGELHWRERPRDHFISDCGWRTFNSRLAKRRAFSVTKDGYRRGSLSWRGKTIFLAEHVVIWKLMTGTNPAADVDHKNGNRDDNRWDNLREATRSQNNLNSMMRRTNTTGFKGVTINVGRFTAQMMVDGIYHNFGRYDTAEEAYAAYCIGVRQLAGEFAKL